MDLNWLHDFLCLCETRNFRAAADRRHVSQPAFSRRIRALERWVGADLFKRGTLPIALTPAGSAFFPTAQKMLSLARDAVDEARTLTRSSEAQVSFAVNHGIALSFFPTWLEALEIRLGPVDMALRTDLQGFEDYLGALEDGTCDFLLCYVGPATEGMIDAAQFPSLVLKRLQVIPVSRPDGEGQPETRVRLDSQEAIPYFGFNRNTILGHILDAHFERLGLRARLRYEVEAPLLGFLRISAKRRKGVAWVPEPVIEEDLADGSLLRAGDNRLDVPIDIRLVRSARNSRRRALQVWNAFVEISSGTPDVKETNA